MEVVVASSPLNVQRSFLESATATVLSRELATRLEIAAKIRG
jgi:hypothetical protein